MGFLCRQFSFMSLRSASFYCSQDLFSQSPNPNKGLMMKNQILDILAALTIAAALIVGALEYFSILTK
jgi:hypothetical protein